MFNLAEYRNKPQHLADFLPWAALVAPGVVLNKDGSLQRTARFRGPDLESATPAELVDVAGRLNDALRRLGSGWAVFVEASRIPAQDYPASSFPDPASALVDAERRAQFEEEGRHFESAYHLTFLSLPPAEEATRAEAWLYEGRTADGSTSGTEVLTTFIDRTDRVVALIDGFVPEAAWLSDAETLTWLHACVSTRRHRVRVPEVPMYLDAILVDEPFTGGLAPRLGSAHLRVLSVAGFPSATWPGILDELNRLAFPYRWSTQAICLDKTDAAKVLGRIRRHWFAKRKSLADIETSTIAPAIVESCPTRLFLPNDRAVEPQIAAIYRRFGLNERQIEILARATPKRDYYCQSRRGNRLFELGLGEVALAFCAASSKSDQSAIAETLREHGRAGFAAAWLLRKGLAWAADLLAEQTIQDTETSSTTEASP